MSHATRKNIGVIGLGIIGRGVAGNLRRRGFPVYVWNRSPRSVPNFVGSPGEVAEICNYIQIFVSDDEALLHTVRQLGEKLTPRHLVFAHSTVAPDSMRAAAEIVERRKARFVEAPFTGSKTAAEKGELVFYVCGNDAALQQSFIIRNKYLDIIANLSYLPGRPDKIGNRTWRPVPNINWKPFSPQVPSYAATDNSKPDYTNVFARCMRHRLPRSINAATNQTAGKTGVRQCRN